MAAAAGARAELRVLLVPRSEEPRGWARVRLSRARDALGALLLPAGIYLEPLGPGGAGRARGSVLPGAWADFMWDSTESDGLQSNKTKLLALGQSHDLFVYEFSVEDGKHSLSSLHSCKEETLKKLLEAKNISLPSISSVKILSFGNNKCKLLLNQFILVHLSFPGEDSPPESCGCFPLALPQEAVGRITDSQFCRGILFLLDSAGWIYVFDCTDGATLGRVSVALAAGTAPVSPLAGLAVSPDLSTAVVTSTCHRALAVQLNTYFRQFPEHLLCKKDPESLPVKPPEGLDEDDLASSEHSMELLSSPFRTERSWKAHLSSLWDRVRRRRTPPSPGLVDDSSLPWYQFFTHLEDHDPEVCEDPETMVAFVPRAVTWAASRALQSQGAARGDAGQQWAQIPTVGAAREMVKVECKLVSGAKAVFVVLAQDTGLSLALWDFESRDVTCSHFGRSSVYVECGAEVPLCLLLTERGLSLVLFGLSQEEFLSRLMLFGSAGVVDSVCRLNGWERCSIPIHALEAGLENRQLDTVDLFLKSKESVFSLSAPCPEHPGDGASQSYLRNLEELRPALNLLCSAIQDSDMEPHSKHFSEQLLNLTLTFLTKQLEEIFVHTEEPDEFLQKAADILTDYIIKLRKFLRKYPRPPISPGHTGADLDEDLPEIEESQEWEKLTPEEVIAEAILSNKIPEAQIFFRRQQHPAESLQEFIQTGLSLAYDCLLKGSTREASELLRNMGFDVRQELHKICFHTQDGRVRELLVKVLQEENYFSEKEKKVIDFVHQVESLYSESFQENIETQSLSSFSSWSSWRRQQQPCRQQAALGCGSPGSSRLRLMFNWALCWDQPLQEMILLPRKPRQEVRSCSAEVLWMHLTAQHDWSSVCSWIEESEPSQAPSGRAAWPPLSPDIIDRSTLCSAYMRQDILNKLARKGIFVRSELEDFELLLQRLSCLGGVLQNPHPVPKYSTASGLDFHAQFVLHCLEHSLQYLLYTYLDYYSLTPSNCPVLGKKELQEAHPWFEFLVQCRGVASNPRDPKMIFQASLANAQMLIPSSQGGVSSILLEGRTLLALATTVYGPGGIDQVLQSEDTEKPLKKVDPQLLKMALTPYPKLKAALFPSCTAHGILPPDISLYHLLQSLTPFDPTKLFGWQSTNTLAVSDAWSELPHFSSPELVSRHAVLERLDFLFYLLHGRPAFAFGTFLGQQLARSKTPRQLILQAAREAQVLAVSSPGAPSVAAACVCFLELLGLDSLRLRVELGAARLISSHRSRGQAPHRSHTSDSLVEKLIKLADGDKAAAAAVLTWLEEAFWAGIEHQGVKRTSSDSRRQWSLVMQFCKLHNLEPSTSFLRECAKSNEWLQFLVQSQLWGHQPAQVIPLLQDFPATLRDHLLLALGRFLGAEPGAALPGSLFQVLLQCQEQPSPFCFLLAQGLRAQAPILSVLAACCPGANLISCLCVWIITSVDDGTRAEAAARGRGRAEGPRWDLQDLAVLWKVFLRRQKSRTLLNGFRLFLKDSPLLHLLEMYELCMNCKKYNEAKTKLDEFQESLTQLAAAGGAAPEVPVPWLEAQALFLLELMLQQCPTQYELRKLLQLLAAAESLPLDGPYVKRLCALSEALGGSSVSISRSILSPCSLEAFQGECSSVLQQLQEQGMFSLAREVAALAELPVDSIVTQEVLRDLHHLRDTGQWHQAQTRAGFWEKCHDTFSKHSICSRAAASFFLRQADDARDSSGQEKATSVTERQLLLTLAGHWLAKEPEVSVQELEEVEKRIWLCRVAQRAPAEDPSFGSLARRFSFAELPALNTAGRCGLQALAAREPRPGLEQRLEPELGPEQQPGLRSEQRPKLEQQAVLGPEQRAVLGLEQRAEPELGPEQRPKLEQRAEPELGPEQRLELEQQAEPEQQAALGLELGPQQQSEPELGPQQQSEPELGPQQQLEPELGPQQRLEPELGPQQRLELELGPEQRLELGPQQRLELELGPQQRLELGPQQRLELELGPQQRLEPELQQWSEPELGPQQRLEPELGPQQRSELELGPQQRSELELGPQQRSELELGPQQRLEPELGPQQRSALAALVGALLDEGRVPEAARVCRYFQLWHRDVSLALHCRALAAGEAGLEQLQPELRALLAGTGEASGAPGSPSPEDWTPLGAPCGDDAVVAALKALAEECVHGRGYCRQVLCLYELSKELGCSFGEVSAREPREVLAAILARQGPERGRRAQAFISCQGLAPASVAPLLAQQITQELLASAQGRGQKQVWNPAVESEALLQLAKLCPDHTLVGMKLLDKISSVPRGELWCITELLILAHGCFSLTCHMEGITRVLQAARLLTEEHLAPREEYGLVVRLLTGIGRYNEMTYIFELLHRKHYFEVLMRKKLDPSGTLKAALLDYTKRCRPGDSEKHNMIALCFSMCREIGQNHEAAASTQLKLIESRPWEESLQDVANLKKLLLKAVTLFIDAAESYSKDSCVRQALRCRRLTRLLTLQLHFLGSGQSTRIINLGRQELPAAILALPRFYQAAIVAEAYEFQPDWAEVLFQQVITRGDFVYLEEFKQQRPLRPGLFEEVAKKVKQQPPADAALRNLKRFLTHCEDIYTYYRLAYDHKFYDVVNSLLKDPQTGCCLNDLLAN